MFSGGSTKTKIQVYAVIRVDESQSIEDAITVKEVLLTLEQAVQEVERLNKLNSNKGAQYFWQATRYLPEGRQVDSQSQTDHFHEATKSEDVPVQR